MLRKECFRNGVLQPDSIDLEVGNTIDFQEYLKKVEDGCKWLPTDAPIYKQLQNTKRCCPETLLPLFEVAIQELCLYQKLLGNEKLFEEYGLERYLSVSLLPITKK